MTSRHLRVQVVQRSQPEEGRRLATYTCYFSYDKNAFCDADFSLEPDSTTLLASGPVDFKRKGFALIVTGGTSGYVGARGQVAEETLPTRNAQRLQFAPVN